MVDEPNLFDVRRKAKRKAVAPVPGGAVQRLIGIWVGLYERRFGEKPVITPRDGAALKRLVLHAGADVVEHRLPLFLELDDAYIAGEGYPLVLLQSAWNKLIAAEHTTPAPRQVRDADATDRYLRRLKGDR